MEPDTEAERERVLAQAQAEAKALREEPDYTAEVRSLDEAVGPICAR
ncbi:hypothetical protein [Xylanimonas ulmi]|uniref:Uncharacterized protein n=1 Tax=Xylanimonas ulmi TaxID=228973 RepID=A0A4Q7M356_9MICO|nr:hypothetical protein [Xylanibacterium ulmi]RZS61944.1 hypothetical protein EV386_2260 [Xylanibacterium ulmi]